MFSNENILILGEYNLLRNIPAFRKVFPRELWFLCEGIFNLQYYDHNNHKQLLKFTTIGISKQFCFVWNEKTTLLYACN